MEFSYDLRDYKSFAFSTGFSAECLLLASVFFMLLLFWFCITVAVQLLLEVFAEPARFLERLGRWQRERV